jgi:hypothetical protein
MELRALLALAFSLAIHGYSNLYPLTAVSQELRSSPQTIEAPANTNPSAEEEEEEEDLVLFQKAER